MLQNKSPIVRLDAGCTIWGKSEVDTMGPHWRVSWQRPWREANGTQGLQGLEGHRKRGTEQVSVVGAGGALRLAEKRKGDAGNSVRPAALLL